MSLPQELELPLVLASLLANGVLGILWLYGKMRRGAPKRDRSLAVLLGMSGALGIAAGAGALFVLNAIVIWSSAPSLLALLLAGVFGWVLALAIVAEALPSQHDRLLMGLAFGGLALLILALWLASREA